MTDAGSTTTSGSAYGNSGQPTPPGGAAFFDWVRGLGFVRGRDRWLAGVCGAIASRTGLDPLVVRGIAVVIAILGGPIFFLYAVGWALMPDESGRSLVEQAVRQVFEPAMIAVGVLLFFTFVPWMQGIWWQGPPEVWGMPGWLEVLLRTSWAIGLTVGIILLVIYIAKRVPSPRNRPATGYGSAAPQTSPYGSAPQSGSAPQPGGVPQPSAASDTTAGAGTPAQPAQTFPADPAPTAYPAARPAAAFVPPIPPVPQPPAAPASATAPTVPVSPVSGSTPPTGPSLWDDLTGHGVPAAAASGGSAPYGSTASGFAPSGSAPSGAAASGSGGYGSGHGAAGYGAADTARPFDPDRYRASHRRKHLGAGYIAVVSGIALSIGAVAASFVADGSWSNSAFLVGASAALAVIALGIVIAGVRGKEGGWLTFFSLVLSVSLAWTAFIPAGTDVATFGDPTWQYSTDSPTGFAMIAGAPTIDLTDLDTAPSGTSREVDVWTAFGDVELLLPDNRTVAVEASSLAGGIDYGTSNDLDRGGVLFHDSQVVAEGAGTGVTTVRVWTLFGQVTINQPAER
ncbi:PspC domain-containing protein [Cryobacterium soli]|jgi:phage shock protein PspC (stress-responsive transcriptional regulator)|uniref:PspC domain-containing protein n=1 Tax=Cryobacterium soli TaxID=2220095 RepID=UPI000E71EA74|nr:PspC domain-containing protein [Cryobacterium soli]